MPDISKGQDYLDDLSPPARMNEPPPPDPDGEQRSRTRFRLVRSTELLITPPDYLIDGLIENNSLSMVFADPAVGKSFFALGLACSVVSGRAFHGRLPKQGPAVYVAGEGHNGLKRRITAWEIAHGCRDTEQLYISSGPAGLCDTNALLDVMDAIDQLEQPPVLVVVDTVARNFGPGDENSTRDMGQFIAAADAIREKYNCCVLLVHHSGHGDKTRARGAMALKGALDAEYMLTRDEAGVIRMVACKMKEAELPEPIAFRLRSVPLGVFADDGTEITSAVLDSVDYTPETPTKGPARGKWQLVALEQLRQLHAEYRGKLEEGGHDPSKARVSLDDWRVACLAAGMHRNRFYDIRDRMIEVKAVKVLGIYVYPDG